MPGSVGGVLGRAKLLRTPSISNIRVYFKVILLPSDETSI